MCGEAVEAALECLLGMVGHSWSPALGKWGRRIRGPRSCSVMQRFWGQLELHTWDPVSKIQKEYFQHVNYCEHRKNRPQEAIFSALKKITYELEHKQTNKMLFIWFLSGQRETSDVSPHLLLFSCCSSLSTTRLVGPEFPHIVLSPPCISLEELQMHVATPRLIQPQLRTLVRQGLCPPSHLPAQ